MYTITNVQSDGGTFDQSLVFVALDTLILTIKPGMVGNHNFKVTINYPIINQKVEATISIMGGCFAEQLSQFWQTTDLAKTHPNLFEIKPDQLSLIYNRTVAGETIELDISTLFKMTADVQNCGAADVRAYSNVDRLTLASLNSQIALKSNPTLKQNTMALTPIAAFSKAATQTTLNLYLEAQSVSETQQPVKKPFNLTVHLCDHIPTATQSIYRIPMTMGDSSRTIDLGALFTHQTQFAKFCNFTELKLSSNEQGIDSITVPGLTLNGSSLVCYPTTYIDSQFYLVAKSLTSLKQAAIQMNWIVTNMEPVFSPPFDPI